MLADLIDEPTSAGTNADTCNPLIPDARHLKPCNP